MYIILPDVCNPIFKKVVTVALISLASSREPASVEQTLMDMSMATQQYLQRHNLAPPHSRGRGGAGKGGGGVTTPLGNKWKQWRGRTEGDNTLNIQALKTLPKLT